jgi:hypothetical protein
LCFVFLLGSSWSALSWSFSPLSSSSIGRTQRTTSPSRSILPSSSSNNNADNLSFPEEPSGGQKQQEMMFEAASASGADVISKMTVPERAKRTMMAEALEDRIFELTETLEGLLDKSGMIAEADREQAMEIAKQTKGLQLQYNDLVSGKPSSILDSLEAMDGPSSSSSSSSSFE